MSMKYTSWLVSGLVLLGLFGIPALLVRMSMDDVPERAEIRTKVMYVEAVNTIEAVFRKHKNPAQSSGRLQPVPENTREWIELLNPMGRKAAGGGLLYLPQADESTGAIGISGNHESVTITMPSYRGLTAETTVLRREDVDA